MTAELPVHPVVVHFPIVFAVLSPVLALWLVLRLGRGGEANPVSWLVAATFTLLAASAFVATETGETDEDMVAAVTGEGPLERHEEAAERLLVLALVGAGLAVAGAAAGRTRARLPLAVATLAAGGVVTWAAVATGHSGGELVYVHGAAQAHIRNSAGDAGTVTPSAPAAPDAAPRPEADEDDD
jgi:uncharacterized membrane protein